MSIADEFGKLLEAGIAELDINEWSLTEAQERAIIDVTPSDAFASIVDVLGLAGKQNGQYAFASCCWFVMDLVKLSNTTEQPSHLSNALVSLIPVAAKLQAETELKNIANWYRIPI